MIPTTTHDMKEAPPTTVLRPISMFVPPSPINDTKLEKTSEAPLPRERRVTPAIVGDSFKSLDRLSSEEQKYSEAVLPNR
jgi:hypothetical protein